MKIASGYGKRSLTGHEAAPYLILVDHLAAASDYKETTFANVSTIECPSKPSDYTCPKVLNGLNKEQLKAKLCEYDTILTGSATLIPDTGKAQTRCGAMKMEKPIFKNAEDQTELSNKMAVVFGRDCELKSIVEKEIGTGTAANTTTAATNTSSSSNNNYTATEQLFHMLVKASSIPSSTKFILADGANMDLLSGSVISRDEIVSIMKQCPKAQS